MRLRSTRKRRRGISLPEVLISTLIIGLVPVSALDMEGASLQTRRVNATRMDGPALALEPRTCPVQYKSSGVSEPNSALITGDPAWSTYDTSKSFLYKIHGTYVTSTGSVVQISPGSWRREKGN